LVEVSFPQNHLATLFDEGHRTRSSWNDRLAHWERPASESEEIQIERAASMVRFALTENTWLRNEGVQISAQGSYFNNTNVRLESDMDLRAVHPLVRIEYAPNVLVEAAQTAHGVPQSGRYFSDVITDLRREITMCLGQKFGAANVDGGNKAIRLKKLRGSRADVDIVPVFSYIWMWWDDPARQYRYANGATILGKDGTWINNFPDQHYANGINKRARTRYRFKRFVRIFKRLRDELVRERKLAAGRVPSFLIECLTYAVEDDYFLVETDDRYDRAKRILGRLWELLDNPGWVSNVTEINGIKFLFRVTQPWTVDDAKGFVALALAQLRI
jgi:hypothetical protein